MLIQWAEESTTVDFGKMSELFCQYLKIRRRRFIIHLDTPFSTIVETSASLVKWLLPKSIHTTNTAGFELKVILFMLALSFDRLL
jgi:hypothetical protein